MLNIIITTILVSAFFIFFFVPETKTSSGSKNKTEVSTSAGFIEDTYRGPITDRFIPPKYGSIGSFVGYSGVPEYNWLHGFPHEKTQ